MGVGVGPGLARAGQSRAGWALSLGLAVAGVEVDDIGSTAKTLPEFPQLWSEMLLGKNAAADAPINWLAL